GGAVEGDGVGGGGGDAVGGLLALGGHVDEDLHHVAVALGFRQVGGEQAGGGGVLHLAQPGADHVDGGVELGGQLCGDALGERGAPGVQVAMVDLGDAQGVPRGGRLGGGLHLQARLEGGQFVGGVVGRPEHAENDRGHQGEDGDHRDRDEALVRPPA